MDGGKLRKYQEFIKKLLEAFREVPFELVVESTIGYKVIPVDEVRDAELLDELSSIASLVSRHYNSSLVSPEVYAKFTGKIPDVFRPNEVSRALEYIVFDVAKNSVLLKKK